MSHVSGCEMFYWNLCCCSALIKLLQESVGIETCSPQFLELIMKVNNSCLLYNVLSSYLAHQCLLDPVII